MCLKARSKNNRKENKNGRSPGTSIAENEKPGHALNVRTERNQKRKKSRDY
jgi:hypothetical protein